VGYEMMNKQRRAALSLLAVSILSACSVMQENVAGIEAARKDVQRHSENAESIYNGQIARMDRPYLVGRRVSLEKRKRMLPEELDRQVTFRSVGVQSLQDIVESISQMTKVPMFLGIVSQSGAQSSAVASSGAGALGGLPMPPVGMPSVYSSPSSSTLMAYHFSGRLSQLLDDLALRADVSWRYDDELQRVEFYRYDSKVFSLMLPPGKKTMSASISIGSAGGSSSGSGSGGGSGGSSGGGSGGGGSGGGSSGGSGGSVNVTGDLDIDPWTSVLDGVSVLLESGGSKGVAGGSSSASSGGSSGGLGASSGGASAASSSRLNSENGYVIVNRDLSQIIVVAKPKYMDRVEKYVEQINKRFARNVLIDVRVYDIQLSDAAQAGISANFQKVLSKYGVNIVGGDPAGVSSVTGTPSSITISNGSASSSVFDVVAQALSTSGRVSTKNQGQVVAINGQPAPFQQASQITYLSSMQTTQTANVGSQVSLQPGTVTVGFTANFLPTILPDNRIMLQYQINTSTLSGLKTITSGGSSIQAPEISSQSLQQQAYLKDGQAIILFSFEQDRSQNGSTYGFTNISGAGSKNRSMTAVIIQVRTSSL